MTLNRAAPTLLTWSGLLPPEMAVKNHGDCRFVGEMWQDIVTSGPILDLVGYLRSASMFFQGIARDAVVEDLETMLALEGGQIKVTNSSFPEDETTDAQLMLRIEVGRGLVGSIDPSLAVDALTWMAQYDRVTEEGRESNIGDVWSLTIEELTRRKREEYLPLPRSTAEERLFEDLQVIRRDRRLFPQDGQWEPK